MAIMALRPASATAPRIDAIRFTLVAASLAALVSCSKDEKPDSDLSGTYVVNGNVVMKEGKSIAINEETIQVERLSQHYQFSTYEVTARGCKVRGDGGKGDSWQLHGECTFDVPSMGPVRVDMSGGFQRDSKPGAPPSVRVSLSGETRDASPQLVGYVVQGGLRRAAN